MRKALILALLSTTSLAIADDAYWTAVGGAGTFGKSKDIRMVSENVNITLKRKSMHVRAVFNFRNGGPAQTVTTAFPETATFYREPGQTSPAIAITSFKAWVDGKQVPVARKKMPLKQWDEYAKYSAVWLKEVSFPARGNRQVICEYEANYSEGREFLATYYILRSGATWKGTIGDCRIHVDWRQRRLTGAPHFGKAEMPIGGSKRLKPKKISDTSADFHFRNIEPDFDLFMMCSNVYWNFRVNGKHPDNLPIGDNGEALISGDGRDPIIDVVGGVPALLGSYQDMVAADAAQANGEDTDRMRIRHHLLSFRGRQHIWVGGKRQRLRRGVQRFVWIDGEKQRFKSGMDNRAVKMVYVRDLVAALGGAYSYNPKVKRVDIRIPWSRYRKSR